MLDNKRSWYVTAHVTYQRTQMLKKKKKKSCAIAAVSKVWCLRTNLSTFDFLYKIILSKASCQLNRFNVILFSWMHFWIKLIRLPSAPGPFATNRSPQDHLSPEIICGAPTTVVIKGQVMMMMMFHSLGTFAPGPFAPSLYVCLCLHVWVRVLSLSLSRSLSRSLCFPCLSSCLWLGFFFSFRCDLQYRVMI